MLGIFPASAQLAVDRLWVDFEPGAVNRADVQIRNESTDRYYISVTSAEIIAPGSPAEKRVENSDPEKLGLLVTPNRLIVDPGGVRSIRIVSLNTDLTKDRVYRIKVSPQIGDLTTADPSKDDRGMSIKLLAAYDLLVTVRPADGKANLVATRTPTMVTITNQGNSNALLFEGAACLPDKEVGATEAKCEKIGSRRMYPGAVWDIPISHQDVRLKFKERLASSSLPKEVAF